LCRARSGSTGFWRRFQRKFREALVQSQVKFNRVPEKVPEKIPGGFGAEPGQVEQGSGEGSGEGLGGFGAAVQVQQCSEEGSWRRSGRLWCRARSGSTGFWRRFQEAWV